MSAATLVCPDCKATFSGPTEAAAIVQYEDHLPCVDQTYRVDCRDVFTIHLDACYHLHLVDEALTYTFEGPPVGHPAIEAAALVAFNGGDLSEGQTFAFAPCMESAR